MKAKEKAIELMVKLSEQFNDQINEQLIKECALIVVDEIIDALAVNAGNNNSVYGVKYWIEVENEIIEYTDMEPCSLNQKNTLLG